jgi:hypothetical protein
MTKLLDAQQVSDFFTSLYTLLYVGFSLPVGLFNNVRPWVERRTPSRDES